MMRKWVMEERKVVEKMELWLMRKSGDQQGLQGVGVGKMTRREGGLRSREIAGSNQLVSR